MAKSPRCSVCPFCSHFIACQIGPDQDTPSHPRIKPLSLVICPEPDDAEPSGQCRDPEVYRGTGLNLSATCTGILQLKHRDTCGL